MNFADQSVHEHREPVIVGPRGNLTNHHWTADGLIGDRVKDDEAQFFVVTVTHVRVEEGPA